RGLGVLGVMPRPGRQLAQLQGAQFTAQRLLADRNAKFVEHPLCEVDQPPAHHAMTAGIGPLSTISSNACRCAWVSSGALPGALPFTRPGGPSALNASTQSRTVCSPTPPIFAASVRDPPS